MTARWLRRLLVSANDRLVIRLRGWKVEFDCQPYEGGEGGPTSWGNITGTLADQADLTTALQAKAAADHDHDDDYEPAGSVAALAAATTTALAGKSNTGHGHAIADVSGLQTALDAKAAASHTHAISDVTSLQTALDGKAAASHTHAISDVTNLQSSLDGKAATSHGVHVPAGGTTGQALKKASNADGDVSWQNDEEGAGGPLAAWPVGSLYIAFDATSPATKFGGGTWEACGAGRVLVGIDAGQEEFDTAGQEGGAKTHTLTADEMPAHTHTQDAHTHTQDSHNHTQNAHSHVIRSQTSTSGSATSYEHGTLDTSSAETEATETTDPATATNQAATATNQDATAVNQNTGGGQAHNNLQPYLVVYMWKRTA